MNNHNDHALVCKISLKSFFFENKLLERLGKPKDLWKAIK